MSTLVCRYGRASYGRATEEQATEEISRLVIETARQQPATLKDFRTPVLAIEMQTRLLEFGTQQIPAHWQSPGGNCKEVLPLPDL
jgi:hypothetical protein